MGRFTTGLVILALLHALAARATTAPSLSDRIHVDGVLDEYAADEWVLDATSALAERPDDSAWGSADEVTRVALTWDHDFLYLAVEGRALEAFLSLVVSNRAGGLRSLEEAGDFRRAVELPGLPVNLIALAAPERVPDVARADDSHPFALVAGSALPRAVAGVRGGVVGFEMAVPWSMLSLTNPVRVVAAITGQVGTGAGDAAPDAHTALDDDRFARAVLDRHLVFSADSDGDGVPDDSVSTRDVAAVQGGTTPASSSNDAEVRLDVVKRAFAPDRGEYAELGFEVESGAVFVNLYVYSLEGERVRFVNEQFPDVHVTAGSMVSVLWGGMDDNGAIVAGGTYIVVADWGYSRGEHSGRAKAAVVVVR
jgi:hypothetical protein